MYLLESFSTEGLILLVAAYLAGSISSAVLICRLLGYPDPREEGSSNPGATNVMRIAGRGPAIACLAFDVLKGVLPVLAGRLLGIAPEWLALIGLAAFLGHIYPVFFGFLGGKGVATALGVLTTLSWQAGVAVMLVWLVVFLPKRISSLASIVSWVFAPLIVYWLAPQYLLGCIAMAVVLVARHYRNIHDLIKGEEHSFGKKPKP